MLYNFSNAINGDEDDFLDRSDVDISDLSPERNPRSNLASAKSIHSIREDDEDEGDDVLLELSNKFGKR